MSGSNNNGVFISVDENTTGALYNFDSCECTYSEDVWFASPPPVVDPVDPDPVKVDLNGGYLWSQWEGQAWNVYSAATMDIQFNVNSLPASLGAVEIISLDFSELNASIQALTGTGVNVGAQPVGGYPISAGDPTGTDGQSVWYTLSTATHIVTQQQADGLFQSANFSVTYRDASGAIQTVDICTEDVTHYDTQAFTRQYVAAPEPVVPVHPVYEAPTGGGEPAPAPAPVHPGPEGNVSQQDIGTALASAGPIFQTILDIGASPIALDLNGDGAIGTTGASTVMGHAYDGGILINLDAIAQLPSDDEPEFITVEQTITTPGTPATYGPPAGINQVAEGVFQQGGTYWIDVTAPGYGAISFL